MFSNVFKKTANRRALAAIINTLDIEIITRRDTAKTAGERMELRMFLLSHKSFMTAWNNLTPDTDPLSYAVAWDAHLFANKRVNHSQMEDLVKSSARNILVEIASDMNGILPIVGMEAIRHGEKALADITAIDQRVALV